jgi:hypothetical protein
MPKSNTKDRSGTILHRRRNCTCEELTSEVGDRPASLIRVLLKSPEVLERKAVDEQIDAGAGAGAGRRRTRASWHRRAGLRRGTR